MQLTPLALVTLAIISEQPRHPYDVYATMRQRREEQTVKLSAGTLYHTINRLAECELLAEVGTDREGNRPERTVYRITEAGRTALDNKVRDWLREPAQEFPQFPVAIGEIHHLPDDEAAAMLTERIVALDARIETLDLIERFLTDKQVPQRFWLDLDLIRHMTRAERDWCQQTADAITSHGIPWSQATDAAPKESR
ncbi:PadR family transcriptional regulator [Enemella dayhoffiae]|uniref:PadR family transcriptional regulator n=1 Tax=Enemella dayhoffiae TaxID=2016507 RepID=UPI0011403103|nr:PadR family transcriptional regulator [Enemella dayhoffiae]